MISHALTIIANEMQRHFAEVYGSSNGPDVVVPGNIADVGSSGAGGVPRSNSLVLSVVNVREEKTLKNLPNAVRNDVTMRVVYENPPLFLNLTTLITATHQAYDDALVILSRALRFFQSNNVFTHTSVAPESLIQSKPKNDLDVLSEFKLIFDLYSPTLEEVNHMWGTLGGKQYPFALFNVRLLDLKFRAPLGDGGLITQVTRNYVNLFRVR